MMNRPFLIFLISYLFCFSARAEIKHSTHIEDILPQISENTLVLFNIAEVLMDTETSLGTQAWRKYVRKRVPANVHDELTLYVFANVPPKAVEPITPKIISQLQQQQIPVLAFTSRGRQEWYSTQKPDIDLLTEKLLRQINIDFSQTSPSELLSSLNSLFKEYYHDGIIYGTNELEKGELLVKILRQTPWRPSNIVFIDDKLDSLRSMDEELQKELEIPFAGYVYSRTAQDHAHFDPMIAHIQLDWLLTCGTLLSDAEAKEIKAKEFADVDHEAYFKTLMEKWEQTCHIF